jgi:hypothetical protein
MADPVNIGPGFSSGPSPFVLSSSHGPLTGSPMYCQDSDIPLIHLQYRMASTLSWTCNGAERRDGVIFNLPLAMCYHHSVVLQL